ncbi:MAG: methyltransferase family protein [Anaerolineae bacterium]
MSEIGVIQITILGLFLAIVSIRATSLSIHQRVRPVWFSLDTGLVFSLVLIWAGILVWQIISPDSVPLPRLLGKVVVYGWVANLVGFVLILSGITLFCLAMHALGKSWRLVIDERRPGQLVQNGVYSYSRNPVYLFFELYFFGTFLINGQVVFLVATCLLIPLLHWTIIREERFLSLHFGQLYTEYCQQVARYFSLKKLVARFERQSAEGSPSD